MKKIELVALVIAIVVFAQVLVFYRGIYIPPPAKEPDFLGIDVNSSIPVETNDIFTKGTGTVLIDMSHENNINTGDLDILISRILARGYRVEYYKGGSDLKNNLSRSTSFVVVSPSTSFSPDEVKSVKEFTDGEGRLLMLSEPIKNSEINSLAAEFGMLFWNDYLYNLKENDGNFKYIYLADFKESNITKGLKRVVFYTANSVFGDGIIFTGNDTFSSSRTEKGRYAVAAMTENSRVLAIGDVTFMSEPYDVMDNNRLIYNIADFLAPPDATVKPPEIIPVIAVNVTGGNNTTAKIAANTTAANTTNP